MSVDASHEKTGADIVITVCKASFQVSLVITTK
jgi:hypothetical protein